MFNIHVGWNINWKQVRQNVGQERNNKPRIAGVTDTGNQQI